QAVRRVSSGKGFRETRQGGAPPAEGKRSSFCFVERRRLATRKICRSRRGGRLRREKKSPAKTLCPAAAGFSRLTVGASVFEDNLVAHWVRQKLEARIWSFSGAWRVRFGVFSSLRGFAFLR